MLFVILQEESYTIGLLSIQIEKYENIIFILEKRKIFRESSVRRNSLHNPKTRQNTFNIILWRLLLKSYRLSFVAVHCGFRNFWKFCKVSSKYENCKIIQKFVVVNCNLHICWLSQVSENWFCPSKGYRGRC